MKLEPGENGFVIDVNDLAPLLEIAPDEVQDLMRAKKIFTQSETGIDEHAGTQRLTFRYNGISVRLTVDDNGRVLKRSKTKVPRGTGLYSFLDAPAAPKDERE
ncbi:DUF6522 family protein [uncultured Roseobacter sp.]|uniref:DUF6522 family protein n=1 Tax=uncultured Roseobacter sp. TaxID=114847 RepID=UPI00262AFFE8|nr:DUF6522 family protein [uncultured Roseobacter sp.]